MVKNPYIGMPIEITDWEDTPCEGCSAGGSGSDNSPDSGNTGGSAGNDNNWQNDGTFAQHVLRQPAYSHVLRA